MIGLHGSTKIVLAGDKSKTVAELYSEMKSEKKFMTMSIDGNNEYFTSNINGVKISGHTNKFTKLVFENNIEILCTDNLEFQLTDLSTKPAKHLTPYDKIRCHCLRYENGGYSTGLIHIKSREVVECDDTEVYKINVENRDSFMIEANIFIKF